MFGLVFYLVLLIIKLKECKIFVVFGLVKKFKKFLVVVLLVIEVVVVG